MQRVRTRIRAPRDGAVDDTVMGSNLLAIAGAVHAHCHGTAGTISAFLDDGLNVSIKPPAVGAAINAVGRGLAGRAQQIRDKEEMQANPAEADETGMVTFVEKEPEDDGSAPGTGRNRRRREAKRGYLWVVLSRTAARVHADPSRAGAVLECNFPDRCYAPTVHDKLQQYYHVCRCSQMDYVHPARHARHAIIRAAADPQKRAVAEALHARFVYVFRRARKMVEGHGGAFQDPDIRKKAQWLEDEVAAIAEDYREAGIQEMYTYLHGAAGHIATFMLYPGLSPDTTGVERFMKWLIGWRKSGGRTVTATGRKIFSDIATVAGSYMVQERSYADAIREELGSPPPPEYAQIRAEGSRWHLCAPSRRRGRGRRGPLPAPVAPRAGADPLIAVPARGPASNACGAGARPAGPERQAKPGTPAKPAGPERQARPAGPERQAKPAKQRTERGRPGGAAPRSAPKQSQRCFAVADVPGKAAAAEKAGRKRPAARARPATVHAAPVAAPSGPGPPSNRGPQNLVAAA